MLVSIVFSVAIYEISSQELSRGLGRQGAMLRDLPSSEFISQPRMDFERTRMEQIQESNNNLKINLVYFNLAILVASSGISYFLARRTLKPIEEMFDLQNRFTADASHELRTPLTAMKTEIEVNLRDKKFNLSEARKLLQSNLEEVDKLELLSNGLLTLTQYQNGQGIEFENILLKDVIEEAQAKVEGLAQSERIEIKAKTNDLKVKGNKQSLVKLLIILLDNAIKYSPKGTGITVFSEISGNYINIKVKDQGIGIKASDLPYIFNPFYRADHSRSKISAVGYGLGLSIAKKIAESHNGKIETESKPGHGSTFTLKLPKSS
jgi:signal transduction histidine kinase